MFCKNCGKEVNENAVVCIHCGCSLKQSATEKTGDMNESKTGMGVLFGLLLGFIGLLIGFLMYPAETVARKTFLKGWGIAFGVSMALSILLGVIYGVAIAGMLM